MMKKMKKTETIFGMTTYWCTGRGEKEPLHTVVVVVVGRRALVVNLLSLKSELPSQFFSFISKSTIGG
ncbi:hypothetical protein AALP_AA7G181500 [Arabis alpina]|uniref:Uncharacterized protein n=1 Tax=Arabis alpina TaxID=50452 RepID=A0A087GIV3_ARAAL|nr:hypothetical protein AALP_AA7G181500 [Arabis alpina]